MPPVSRRLAWTALAGLAAWLALWAVPFHLPPGPAGTAARLVLLAPLVLVPLYLDASAAPGAPDAGLRAASWLVLPGAFAAAAAFLVPIGAGAGALAGLWGLVAIVVAGWAIAGAWRRWRAGALDLPETLVAAGWATLPGGAAWLILGRAGVDTGYGGLLDLLTAAHVHYAGALAAVWAGLLGRTLDGRLRQIYAPLAVGLVVGFWGVAIGIARGGGPTGGGLLETVAVVVLAVSAGGLGGLAVARAGRIENRLTGAMVAVSGGALVLALALAVWFHVGTRLGARAPGIGWMVSRHGWLMAVGFGLWGALGWRRLRPRPATSVVEAPREGPIPAPPAASPRPTAL